MWFLPQWLDESHFPAIPVIRMRADDLSPGICRGFSDQRAAEMR
jgi:hypothetical protein